MRVGPTDAPAAVVRVHGPHRTSTASEFPHLRRFAKVLWSPAYFAASVGYVGDDGAPLHRTPVGRGPGVANQQVKITAFACTEVRCIWAMSQYRGNRRAVWSQIRPGVGGASDGFRVRFNSSATRRRYLTCDDRDGKRVGDRDRSVRRSGLAPIGKSVTAFQARQSHSFPSAMPGYVLGDAEDRGDGMVSPAEAGVRPTCPWP